MSMGIIVPTGNLLAGGIADMLNGSAPLMNHKGVSDDNPLGTMAVFTQAN